MTHVSGPERQPGISYERARVVTMAFVVAGVLIGTVILVGWAGLFAAVPGAVGIVLSATWFERKFHIRESLRNDR